VMAGANSLASDACADASDEEGVSSKCWEGIDG
jgi:hypothetical protein